MAKKIKKYKVGIDSETYAISMVESPAIESDFVALNKEEEQKVFLEKEEKYMVYGAALIPDKDIYRNNGEQEFYISFTKESIEKMSQDFFKDYRQHNVTLDHETDASDITVVESWLKADINYDKSIALGLEKELPVGTWFIGMKVNQIDVWKRIKSGELKGFSVESMISLEEFEKQNKEDMIETNENFWTRLKDVLSEAFMKCTMKNLNEETIEVEEELEEEVPAQENEAQPEAEIKPSEEIQEEKVEDAPEPEEKPVTEPETKPETQPEHNPLEELIKNLQEEVKALRESNASLTDKIKDMGKKPSANPVNTNAKPSASDTYSAWRERMREMIG